MKIFILLTLFVILFAACKGDYPKLIETQINPGDVIDGMRFLPIEKMDWRISLGSLCDMESGKGPITDNTFSCYARPGGRIFFGDCFGVGSETIHDIEKLWQDFKLIVTFDDRRINLPPFGFHDIEPFQPGEPYVRIWNLMVENITSGTHTIQCVEELEDGTDTTTYVFTVSDQLENYPNIKKDRTACG